MKVLMFGWEFPPHISGGLGTACYGLTSSLSKENIEVLFVVPSLSGEESADRTSFINASAIPIPSRNNLEEHFRASSVDPAIREELYRVLRSEQGVNTIVVPSSLTPYRSLEMEARASGLEHWNYTLDEPKPIYASISNASAASSAQATGTREATYRFSGAYGPDLMEEVKRYAQVAAQVARQHEFDVIHAHDWMTYLAGIAAKRVSGKPLVVHVHSTEYDRSGEQVHPSVRAIEQQGMTEADRVVTVSQWTKKIASSRYCIPEEKIEVIHNGIIPKGINAKTFTPPPVGSHIVTFLGRVTHQKGPLFFVEAARSVLIEIPNAHFVVAGSGDQLPLMIERIAQLRMSSHFHFTGFLKGEDVDKVWSMSNVYVMPSVSEPFGIAPLEAIQAGVPVIISKQSGVSEVMPHAIKVDFWNTRELAAAICSVLRYKSLSNTLARNSAEEIGEITWNAAARKLTKLYYGLNTQQRNA